MRNGATWTTSDLLQQFMFVAGRWSPSAALLSCASEVTYSCDGLGLNLMVDYAFGLPVTGWARHSPLMQQRQSNVPRARRPNAEDIAGETQVAHEGAKPSKNPKFDQLA